MNRTMLIPALLATLVLAACDRPSVVNVPATPVVVPSSPVIVPTPVPGPAGPTGATGSTGAPGKSGDTTVIVTPPAPAASN